MTEQSSTRWIWSISRLRRISSSSHAHYLAEVDGLRFLAIVSVLFFHVSYCATHVPGIELSDSPLSFLFWPIKNGHRGVELFFVISGFILALPFAAHFLTNGPAVEVRRFYLRRLTRLEPPYALALLGFYGASIVLGTPDVGQPGFWSGLLLRLGYIHDLVRGVKPSLNGVTWTLEIEVQFYILMPLLAKIFAVATQPRRVALIAGILVTPFLAEMVASSEMNLLGHAQFFLMGLLLADVHCTRAGVASTPARVLDPLGFCCLIALAFVPHSPVLYHLLPWILAVLFLSALRGELLRSVLQRPWIAVLGGMCYSLYLLHYPLYSFLAGKLVTPGLSSTLAVLRVAMIGLPLSIAAGIAFYILIERPCMKVNWPRTPFRSRYGFRTRPPAQLALVKETSKAPI